VHILQKASFCKIMITTRKDLMTRICHMIKICHKIHHRCFTKVPYLILHVNVPQDPNAKKLTGFRSLHKHKIYLGHSWTLHHEPVLMLSQWLVPTPNIKCIQRNYDFFFDHLVVFHVFLCLMPKFANLFI
jgi:hypothetical protein